MKMKITLMLAALVAMAAFTAFLPVRPLIEVGAQKSNKQDGDKGKTEQVELKSVKGTGEADTNIKQKRGMNSMNKKGKGMTRGTGQRTCTVYLTNKTDYNIDIYIDGEYSGTTGETGTTYTTTGSGSTRVYARADFDDGSYLYWGPSVYNCGNNQKSGSVNFTMTE